MTQRQKTAAHPAPASCLKDRMVDERWCSWLPQDWSAALKMTQKGLLLHCYVGPAPEHKRFFHKVALEKHLRRSLGVDERGKKPIDWGDVDPKSFLKHSETNKVCPYIDSRCRKAHGLSVEEAVDFMT